MTENELIIGIDLGTTNSLAAYVTETGPEVIESESYAGSTPSMITIVDGHELIGEEAREARTKYPEETYYSFKRFMGRGEADIDEDLSKLPYRISFNDRGNILMGTGDELLSPEQMSAKILKHVKNRAEDILGKLVTKAVITVPAYFDDAQRQATRDAAEIAGIEVMRIINEPTAAAIAYGLNEKNDGKIAVYDFGGGTFDVSILELKGKLFKVLSTHGNTHLGGDDIDNLLVENLMGRFLPNSDDFESISPKVLQYFKEFAEIIKIELSSQLEVCRDINIPELMIEAEVNMTRDEYDEIIRSKVEETLEHVKIALDDAGLEPKDIDEVVLVGGSTRIPLVRKTVGEYFDRQPHVRINPDQVVSIGAAIQGHLLSGGRKDFLLMDIIPLSLGIETVGGTFSKLILKNASIPAKATEVFSTSVDNQTGIDLTIYQGEREFVRDCRKLGKFVLKGFPLMPAGLPRVEVSFFVDTNGMLTVTAKELRSNAEAKIDIIPTHGLKRSEVSEMIRDSMENALADFNERNLVEFRDKTDSVLAGIDKIWPDVDQYITPEQKEAIVEHRAVLEQYRQAEDALALKAAIDKMGDLTRDLADSIMGDAAKQILTD